jgi:hypothetical protein
LAASALSLVEETLMAKITEKAVTMTDGCFNDIVFDRGAGKGEERQPCAVIRQGRDAIVIAPTEVETFIVGLRRAYT